MIPRRILVSIILIFMVCSVSGILSGRTQQRQPGASFTQPAKLRLDGLIRRRFSDYYIKRDYGWETLITEGFYPIGWSKDGKFAYYSEPGDEACGCYFAKLVILDLRNDKVLWSFDYNGLDRGDGGRKGEPKSINDLWRKNRKLFSDKLREHNIVPQGQFALLSFPINYDGDQLTTELKIKENKDEETRPYGIVSQATLQLVSNRSGKKTVLDKTFDKETDPQPLEMKVLGYTKSPFEPRIAVVLIEVHRGYEGPPHTTHIRVVGSSLSSGFK
jgi:hypothetical protein